MFTMDPQQTGSKMSDWGIWQFLTILLSEADNEDIEIIDNKKINDTTLDIIKIIIQTISAKYKGKLLPCGSSIPDQIQYFCRYLINRLRHFCIRLPFGYASPDISPRRTNQV